MWPKNYKDYPEDVPLKKELRESGKGFSGCEMKEFNGWSESYHMPRKQKKGLIARLLGL